MVWGTEFCQNFHFFVRHIAGTSGNYPYRKLNTPNLFVTCKWLRAKDIPAVEATVLSDHKPVEVMVSIQFPLGTIGQQTLLPSALRFQKDLGFFFLMIVYFIIFRIYLLWQIHSFIWTRFQWRNRVRESLAMRMRLNVRREERSEL